MYHRSNTITQLWVFLLGLLIGSTFVISFFKEGVSAPWATFAGAGAGAIITVLGVAWHGDRRRERETVAIAQRMAPHLIELRARFRHCMLLFRKEDETYKLQDDIINEEICKASDSWLKIQPMLDHFPETARDCWRLDYAFRALQENNRRPSKGMAQEALDAATGLADHFDVDKPDRG